MDIQNPYIRISENIEKQEDTISPRDYAFYHIDRFLLVAKKTKEYKASCTVCKHGLSEMEKFSEEIGDLIGGTPAQKRQYEKQTDTWLKHLKKEHGYSIKGYISASYTFAAMVIGALVGWLFAYFINPGYLRISVPVGWFVGTAAGRIIGMRKEKELLVNNKLL